MGQNSDQPKIQIDCPICKGRFSATIPQAEIVNSLRSSALIAPHEKLSKCINCGQAFVLVMIGCQLQWGYQAVDQSVVEQMEGSRIIKPALIAPN